MHFAQVTQTYSQANKLNEKISQLIRLYDCNLIKDGDLESFKKGMIVLINKLNTEHPRCKPVKAEWWSPSHNDVPHVEKNWTLSFNGASILHFGLTHVRATYSSK